MTASTSPTRPGSRSVSSFLGRNGSAREHAEEIRRGQPAGRGTSALVGSLHSWASAPLGLDPGMEVVLAVEDATAEAEAAGARAQVAPVAQGGDGGAEEFGGF